MANSEPGPRTDADPGYVDDVPETTYNPDEVEITRGREQGLGVGARDLALQRDPERPSVAADEEDEADEVERL